MQQPTSKEYDKFIGEICIGYLKSGHKFAARQIRIEDGAFVFEGKTGTIFFDQIADVEQLVMICPRAEA